MNRITGVIAFVDHEKEQTYAVQRTIDDAMHIQGTIQGEYGGNVSIEELPPISEDVFEAYQTLLELYAFHGLYQVMDIGGTR